MAKNNMQDLMSYQINKFQRTTTTGQTTVTGVPESRLTPPPPRPPPEKHSEDASNDSDNIENSSSLVSTTISTEPRNLKTQHNGLFSCNCAATNNNAKFSSSTESLLLSTPPSSPVDIINYYYCPNCEMETKKSRTLKFGSGGDVFVDKSHHTYYNIPPLLPPKNNKLKSEDSSSNTTTNSNKDKKNSFTVNIKLPKTFDFNLLSNHPSHHLSININICENKNNSSRFPFSHHNNGSTDLSSSSKPTDIKHNLHCSGWYFGKMDWQDSIRVLKSTPIGTFLLRDSGDPNYAFSLSIQTEHGPISSRISYRNGKFQLDSQDRISDMMPAFTNVISLVEHYIKFGLVKNPSGRQVWVDSHGYTFSPVHLKEPKRKTVPLLQHLSRLIINKNLDKIDLVENAVVPPKIKSYILEYPHTV